MISGFSRGINKVFGLLECYAALIGSYLPTFRDSPALSLDCLTLEDGADRPSITNYKSTQTSQKSEELRISSETTPVQIGTLNRVM